MYIIFNKNLCLVLNFISCFLLILVFSIALLVIELCCYVLELILKTYAHSLNLSFLFHPLNNPGLY